MTELAPVRARRRETGRISFYDAQRSRRRHARWWSFLAGPTAVLTGLPLAAVLSPLVFALGVGLLRLVDLAVPLPEGLWSALRGLARALPAALDRLVGATPPGPAAGGPEELALAAATLLVPGLAAAVVLWRSVARLVARVGTTAELTSLEARAPVRDDVEEVQLVNVVEEMAIAAGVAPPEVRVLDVATPHAALLGGPGERAVVVASRGLLDGCDRAATQGIVAHLVASRVNGDPRFDRAVLSLFQTLGVAFALLDGLVAWSPSAWRDLATFGRAAWGRSGATRSRFGEADADAWRLATLLGSDPARFRKDGLYGILADVGEDEPRTRIGRLLAKAPILFALFAPLLALLALVFFLRIQVLLLRTLVVSPLVVPVLRARRYLADATAVALTRDPDGVAAGLRALGATREAAGAPPGGRWLEHRFAVGREGTTRTGDERPLTGTTAPHPALERRLARLVELGAHDEAPPAGPASSAFRRAVRRWRSLPIGPRLVKGLIALFVAPILAFCAYLVLVVIGTLIAFGAVGSVAFAAIAMRFLEWLLLALP